MGGVREYQSSNSTHDRRTAVNAKIAFFLPAAQPRKSMGYTPNLTMVSWISRFAELRGHLRPTFVASIAAGE